MDETVDNWKKFVKATQTKIDMHRSSHIFWLRTHTVLQFLYIILSAVTTGGALSKETPKIVLASLSAAATVISMFGTFLRPGERAADHAQTVREYRSLKMRMIHCETLDEYEKIWADFNSCLLEEPMAPSCFQVSIGNLKWTMNSRLHREIEEANKISAESDLKPVRVSMECVASTPLEEGEETFEASDEQEGHKKNQKHKKDNSSFPYAEIPNVED